MKLKVDEQADALYLSLADDPASDAETGDPAVSDSKSWRSGAIIKP